MTAEFNVWLLIVGLVVGAGLVWLVIMDSRRRESEVDEVERPREAAWLSAVMADDGWDVSPEAAEQLLLLHQAYLQATPPDGAIDRDEAGDPAGESRNGAPTTAPTMGANGVRADAVVDADEVPIRSSELPGPPDHDRPSRSEPRSG